MLPRKQAKAYSEFYDLVRNNNVLNPKVTLMIHLASAMAWACYP
jgi:hypothetical protein